MALASDSHQPFFSSHLREVTRRGVFLIRNNILHLASQLAVLLSGFNVTATQITVVGCLISMTASLALLWGSPLSAGLLFWLGGSLDMVDGALARQTGTASAQGAFVDSLLDRIGEGSLLLTLIYLFAVEGNIYAVMAGTLAILGSLLTSYIRARAEGLGVACTEGAMTRPERVILLVFGLLVGCLSFVIYLLAILSMWTAYQRAKLVYLSLGHKANQ